MSSSQTIYKGIKNFIIYTIIPTVLPILATPISSYENLVWVDYCTRAMTLTIYCYALYWFFYKSSAKDVYSIRIYFFTFLCCFNLFGTIMCLRLVWNWFEDSPKG